MRQKTRRAFFATALALAAAGAVAWTKRNPLLRWILQRNRNDDLVVSGALPADGTLCVLTPRQVEGPFFISAPHRRNVKEDRRGKELDLTIRVTRVPDCTPVPDAIVEIWHCDAEGVYSGYPAEIPHDLWKTMLLVGSGRENVAPVNDQRFLRGAQITDAGGRVSFETIFPGWYEPRSPHIHLKILADDRTLFVSQLYFDPELSDRVYLRGPYARYGPSPYRPDNDVTVHEFQNLAGLLLEPRWRDDGPLQASALIGIAG